MQLAVIKIGTNLLTTSDRKLDVNHLRQLVLQVGALIKRGDTQVVLVSSGAITCGSEALGGVAVDIPDKQAAAAVGQVLLMQEYSRWFNQLGLLVGQILLTKDGLEHPLASQNAINTIRCLLDNRVVPIINENDSVATNEIGPKFGDNDELSSVVAQLLHAERLVLLSDVDGVYSHNPKTNSQATRIDRLPAVTDEVLGLVDDVDNGRSRGGMRSKLLAARSAVSGGVKVIIADGRCPTVLTDLWSGGRHGTVIGT